MIVVRSVASQFPAVVTGDVWRVYRSFWIIAEILSQSQEWFDHRPYTAAAWFFCHLRLYIATVGLS